VRLLEAKLDLIRLRAVDDCRYYRCQTILTGLWVCIVRMFYVSARLY